MQEEMLTAIQHFLIEKVNPSFIILFGSYAKETTHEQSDVDIAFYSEDETIGNYELFLYAQELADQLKVEVDLVNLREASTVFQAQIFSTGTVIYCKDDLLRMNIAMRAFSMYAKLNEERAPILQAIEESGSIYEK